MKDQVLVAYASTHGATREIAEAVARELSGRGAEADLRPVDDVSTLAPYRAVVVGSAIYEGDWLMEATDFVRRFAAELEELPVWVFSSGVAGDVPRETMNDWRQHPKLLNSLLTSIRPRECVLFGGRFETEHLSLGDWWRYPSMRGVTGDFRNWEEIAAWARSIGDALRRDPEPTAHDE